MSVIDNRIVEMQFNNKQFESGVRETMGTIDKLKQSLNFHGAEKGLGNLAGAINKIDLSPISVAIESAGAKFSWLEQIAIGACRNIGAEISSTLTRYAKELSIGQISAGWDKYADKTTSVQTILAATGESMEDVNEQLDKLNWFTDETSYNFVDMVNNIGKFTSNGIKLDTSVTAMQGIANWAAISGQNAQSASRAMYNLAQAIGTGSVKLIDWKSIENANMATQEFKQKVLEAAEAQGKLKKQTDGTYKTLKGTSVTVQNFNSALSEGWFDKNVLLTTLDAYGSVTNKIFELSEASGLTATDILQLVEAEKNGTDSTAALNKKFDPATAKEYAASIKELAKAENDFGIKTFKAAQEAKTFQDAIDATKDAVSTGWMKTFELIFGDYEHAKVLWTDFANNLYDIFAAGGEARNELLGEWSNSGWDNLQAQLRAAGVSVEEFDQALFAIADLQGFDLQKIGKEYASISEAAAAGEFGIEGIEAAIKRVANASKGTTKTVNQQVLSYEKLDELGTKLRAGQMGGWTGKNQLAALMAEGYTEEQAKVIMKYAEASHALSRSLTEEEAAEFLKQFGEELEVVTELTDEEIEQRKKLEEYSLDDFFTEAGPKLVGDIINNTLTGIIDTIALLKETWNDFFGSVTAKKLKDLTTKFRDFTDTFSLYTELDDGTEELNERGQKVKDALDLVFGAFRNVMGIVQNVGRIFKQFLSTLDPVKKAAGGLAKSLITLFTAVTGKANNFLSRLDLTSRFQKVSNLIASAIDWITEKVGKLQTKFEQYDFSAKLETVKTKVSNLKKSLKELFGISDEGNKETEETVGTFEKLGKVFSAVKDFFAPVKDFFTNLWGNMQGIFDFSQVTNVADFLKAVVEGLIGALGGLWDGLMAGLKNLDISFGDALKMFLGWKVGNRILSSVLKDGEKGIGGLTNSLIELVGNVKEKGIMGLLTGDSEKKGGGFKEFATSLLMVGGALLMIAAALAIVAAIKPEELAKSFGFLVGTFVLMAGVLVGLGAALKALKINSLQLVGAAAALMLLGVALIFLAGAMALFALVVKMDSVWKGLGLMAASLAVVALALGLLAKTCSGVKLVLAAGAILITATALLVLAGALALFTLVADMDGTTRALKVLAVTLGVVVIALMALAAAGPMVIVGAGALLIASVAIIALVGAIALLALAMPLLETGLTALGNGILQLTTGICESIALVISTIATGIVDIANGISEALSSFGSGISDFGTGVGEAIEAVGTSIGTAAEAILNGIGEGLAELGTSIGTAIEEVGSGIGSAISEIGSGIGTAAEEAFSGIGTGVAELGTGIGEGISGAGAGIGDALASISTGIIIAGMGIGTAFTFVGQGIGNAVALALGGLAEGITLVGVGIGEALTAVGTGISDAGAGIGEAFASVGSGAGEAMHAALDGLGEGISGVGAGIGEAVSAIGTGIGEAGAGVSEAFTALGTAAGEAMHAALDGLGEGIGGVGSGIGTAISAIGTGISDAGASVGEAFTSIGSGIGEAMHAALDGLAEGIASVGGGISEAIDLIGASISASNESIGTSIESLGTSIGTGFENAGSGVSSSIETVSSSIDSFGSTLSAKITEVSDSLSGGVTKISESISSLAESISSVGSGLSDIGTGAIDLSTGLQGLSVLDLVAMANGLNEFRSTLVKYNNQMTAITGALTIFSSLHDELIKFKDLGSEFTAISEVLSGVGDIFNFLGSNIDKKGNLKNAANIGQSINTMLADVITAISAYAPEFRAEAEYLMDEFLAGFESKASSGITAITEMCISGVKALRYFYNAFNSAGQYLAIGFNNGMVSQQAAIVKNARAIGAAAASALRSYLKIQSPSRVFAEIGEYTMLGFAKGIEDTETSVVNSILNVGGVMVDAMQTAMSYASSSEYGLSPTITPVLDMSNMMSESAMLQGIISDFNLQGAIANASIDGATINNTIQSRDIINEIRLLNDRMAIMDENLKNMQVVLDTGALVGGTSAKMDNQFGLMAMRKGRGN